MKAIIFEDFGEPADVLQVRDVPDPQPGPGEVLVKMIASPINPSDLMSIRGTYGRQARLPATPGFEGVGTVEKSGGGLLGKTLVGKRVAVLNRDRGNWCEKTVVPAKQAIHVSNRLTDEQVATFFVNPAAAWVMTQEILQVPRNAWLLQTAAGSTLGKMVTSLGRRFGFRTINVVRRPEQAAEIDSPESPAITFDSGRDDDEQTMSDRIAELVGPDGLRYVIDPVGGPTGSAMVRRLGKGGRMLVYGTLANDPTLHISPRTLMTVGASIEGFWLSNHMAGLNLIQKLRLIRQVSKHIQNGTLQSAIGSTHMLKDFQTAIAEAERPGRSGKVLLTM
jgi:NADPH2:quinone reductase